MGLQQIEELLGGFVEDTKALLGENLVGVYLHGSLVMGCFNPQKSDIDLIVVVDAPLSDAVKRAFLETVVAYNAIGPAKGIEMSVVLRAVCRPFVYPTPYELHFSAGHLDSWRADPDAYIRRMKGVDKDLAAHFTIINKRGRCLYGAPIRAVFGEVPREAYLDSLLYDVEGAPEEITEYPMYLTLNLARVLAWREAGLVLSKQEGGQWALEHLPPEYRPLIRDALREYCENAEVVYEEALARRYANYAIDRITQGIRPDAGGVG
jgi:streptomycin 3"-adenylyltransferase